MDATCFHLAHRSIFLTSQVDTLKDVSAKLSQSFCIVLAQGDVEAGSPRQVDPPSTVVIFIGGDVSVVR